MKIVLNLVPHKSGTLNIGGFLLFSRFSTQEIWIKSKNRRNKKKEWAVSLPFALSVFSGLGDPSLDQDTCHCILFLLKFTGWCRKVWNCRECREELLHFHYEFFAEIAVKSNKMKNTFLSLDVFVLHFIVIFALNGQTFKSANDKFLFFSFVKGYIDIFAIMKRILVRLQFDLWSMRLYRQLIVRLSSARRRSEYIRLHVDGSILSIPPIDRWFFRASFLCAICDAVVFVECRPPFRRICCTPK